ncbi:RsmD family RNA methyltransferase [Microbacterium sp. RD1]|uniref:RsmD family RNA methyltransferase n=1 Tax=Microbacterium sp. RD1 TaxID=3457313 RepID=UPI003FA5ECB1
MTRIIAGGAGGTVLDVPDAGTRPTSDRVRESLFGALESADLLRGARVADLYAGSGALGLEAASRGAASVDLVEMSARAAAVARKNADRVTRSPRVAAQVRVHRAGVAPFLRTARGPYDLVLIDPPYDVPDREITTVLALLAPALDPDAVVVVERAKRSPAPRWDEADMEVLRDRTYGDTTMWWGQPRAASQSR